MKPSRPDSIRRIQAWCTRTGSCSSARAPPHRRELSWSHRKAVYKWLALDCLSVFDLDILTRHWVYTNLFTSIGNSAIQTDTIWGGFWSWLLHIFWEIFLFLLAFCNWFVSKPILWVVDNPKGPGWPPGERLSQGLSPKDSARQDAPKEPAFGWSCWISSLPKLPRRTRLPNRWTQAKK